MIFSGISQLTLDEEPEDYESVSDQTSAGHRSGDSLLSNNRQNTVTTFGFVDKNNAPLPSPSHSLLTDTHNSSKTHEKPSSRLIVSFSSYVYEKFSLSTSLMHGSDDDMQQQ